MSTAKVFKNLISLNDIKTLFTILSQDEEQRIQKYIVKKQNMAKNYPAESMNMGENNWPLAHIEEDVLINNRRLVSNWKELYLSTYFNGFDYRTININKICKEYMYGIQWIWAYYTGSLNKVCFNWFYPFNLPPLWQWIRDYIIEFKLPAFPEQVLLNATDIKTVEQLALVLPLESWELIPECPERLLPLIAPQFYPSVFSFESVGKRFFWECESMIPLPSILEVKEIIKHYT